MSDEPEKKDDVFEEEENSTLTIGQYIQGMEDREMEADMVLGGDFGDACTYEKGYMKRQALFSCLTCTPEGNAGICTACSLSCHEGHEILELWTKRNFKCDCGNSKFGNFICKLQPGKDVENAENSYNHNFRGTYCTCDRPYPDPDVEEEEEMVQCCVCEDWFHRDHLGLESAETIPVDEEGQALYEDLICPGCLSSCSFLTLYPEDIFVACKTHDVGENDDKGKGILEEASPACASSVKTDNTGCKLSEPIDNGVNMNSEETTKEQGLVTTEITEKDVSPQDGHSDTPCLLGDDVCAAPPFLNGKKAVFLGKTWRDRLCRCNKCSNFYKEKRVGFLLDKDDSIAEYENQAKQRRDERIERQEQNTMNMFNNLDHVVKVEIMSGIADMQNEIGNFLASHEPTEAITPADVYELFDKLKNKRRRQM